MANRSLHTPTVTVATPQPSSVVRPNRNDKLWHSLAAHGVLIVLATIFVIPFIWLLSTSLKPTEQLFKLPPEWIPRPFMWSNYAEATTFIPFFLYLKNTVYITVFNVVAMLISCSLVAYGFARIQWPGRDALFFVLIATLMIPGAVLLIPTFIIFRNLGWVGTPHPLTWPAFAGNAFYIFLLRQFYLTIPRELQDAATIDGCGSLRFLITIVLPLARPALGTLAVYSFLQTYNQYLWPLLITNDQQMRTVQIGIALLQDEERFMFNTVMAGVVLVLLPTFALFIAGNRQLIRGLTAGAVKG